MAFTSQASLEAYFRRRSFPRLTLSLLLLLTALTGFLISYAMLELGMQHMWVRYPIATLGSYCLLLALIRGWVAIERSRFDPEYAAIADGDETDRTYSVRASIHQHSWFDWLDIPDFGIADLDEGCLPAILFAVVAGLLVTILVTVSMAPGLIAEVFLDAFIVSALYRRLSMAQKGHWLGAALKKTWAPALVTAVILAIGGWALERMAPGAPSIGKAIQQLRGQTE